MIKYGNKKNFLMGSLLVFLIDQMTKLCAYNFLPFDKEHVVNNLFSLHLIYNESYIMMSHNVLDQESFLTSINQFNILYTLVCVLLCAAIFWVTKQPALNEEKWSVEFAKTGLFFICGGILGNAFDRIFRIQGVIDFVRVKDGDNYDFIFNFADVAVFMGEFCLAIAWLLVILSFVSNKFNIFKFKKFRPLTKHF